MTDSQQTDGGVVIVSRPEDTQEHTRSAFDYSYYDNKGYLCNPDGTRWTFKHSTPAKEQPDGR